MAIKDITEAALGVAAAQGLDDLYAVTQGTAVPTAIRRRNMRAWFVLAQSAVAAALTGSTAETVLATISLPAGAMGANGVLRVTSLWSYTNSANVKTLRGRLGGLAGTQFLSQAATTTVSARLQFQVQNRNAANSQVGGALNASFGVSGQVAITSAINTAVAQDIVLTGQLASAGETITLEAYLVELSSQA